MATIGALLLGDTWDICVNNLPTDAARVTLSQSIIYFYAPSVYAYYCLLIVVYMQRI